MSINTREHSRAQLFPLLDGIFLRVQPSANVRWKLYWPTYLSLSRGTPCPSTPSPPASSPRHSSAPRASPRTPGGGSRSAAPCRSWPRGGSPSHPLRCTRRWFPIPTSCSPPDLYISHISYSLGPTNKQIYVNCIHWWCTMYMDLLTYDGTSQLPGQSYLHQP